MRTNTQFCICKLRGVGEDVDGMGLPFLHPTLPNPPKTTPTPPCSVCRCVIDKNSKKKYHKFLFA